MTERHRSGIHRKKKKRKQINMSSDYVSYKYMKPNKELDEKAVENFREYLRIPSAQPDVNYDECVKFLTKQAQSLNLSIQIHQLSQNKPVVILTWVGIQPSEKSILLNSHMDVVPAYDDRWTYPPFSAHMDDWGNIYGRGSQDTKCVGIQYLEAIRRLIADGKRCKRTIHITFVPDGENYSLSGLEIFVVTSDFKALNVGFALDVGMASTNENEFLLFNREKSTWLVRIKCESGPVEGSIIWPDNTAGVKFKKILDSIMEIDITEKQKYLEYAPLNVKSDEVTSVTLTKVWGGVDVDGASDVLPSELSAMFEIHLSSIADHKSWEDFIDNECEKIGIKYFFEQKDDQNETKLEHSHFYWRAIKDICSDTGIELDIKIRSTSSDSRFLRKINIPVVGFSPINNTRVCYHDHDEYINKRMFLQGIGIYYLIIWAIGIDYYSDDDSN